MLDELRRALRMESPTPRLSESNLKKLSRGLRSSKKSLHSVHSVSSVPEGQLGGRSVSLSTLLPSNGHGGMRPRVDKLQTLEAKMAGIEVSLGWKKRREAMLETLPRAARDLVRELDTLHAALRDKDQLIQSLRTQITNLGGTVGGAGGGSGGIVSEAEKRSITDRLAKVTQEMDAKKVAIKNLKLTLEKIDITDNIDVRIRAAELEYELEREELNVLNLKEECNVLTARLQESSNSSGASPVNSDTGETCFHRLLSSTHGGAALAGAFLVAVAVNHTPGNPPFHVTPRPPLGCVIDWATDDTRLRKGDRLVEVNGSSVIGRGLEVVTRFIAAAKHLDLVVARPVPGHNITSPRRADVQLEKQLDERTREMKECVSKLDKALKDKETLKGDNTRLNHRISYLEDQVSELQSSVNSTSSTAADTKKGTRDSVVTSQTTGATVIQVFQKGGQTLAVASPELDKRGSEHAQQYPTLPRIRSPASTCSSSTSSTSDKPPQHSKQSTSTSHNTSSLRPPRSRDVSESRQEGGHRRMVSPRPESRNEDSRPSSRSKPVPPKKPERLSLHRTTSMQSIEEGIRSISRASSSNNSRGNVLQTWPSNENDFSNSREASEYSFYHENGDGGVTMVLNDTAPVSQRLRPQGEERLRPQGEVSPPVRGSRIRDTKSPMRRSQSPDSALHLDGELSYDSSQEIYGYTGNTSVKSQKHDSSQEIYGYTGYSSVKSQSRSYHNSHKSHINGSHKKAMSNDSRTHRSSAALNGATLSPRPHEQWC